MGLPISLLCSSLLLEEDEQQYKGLMLGLDGSGKTTILYQLKLAEVAPVQSHGIQTMGRSRTERVDYKNIGFTVCDTSNQSWMQRSLKNCCEPIDGIIFVVDSNDTTERLDKAMQELHRVSSDERVQDAPVLVVANKQDLPNALTASKLAKRLDLNRLHNQWHIQPCCTITGEGLYEGLDWLSHSIK